ncbi:hypothetical protein TNIN_421991 [Trichonephila inaurata madagascariensis]|uniref:Uncharacterized protein n=1 Tax=Trichonephila inaurata madagascariensis TaxID=2747483 RepID=A0A8X6YWK6_9ARAC|nr:hypothetical protein TNIN_421991 [Trichonephila inaurata madagascariensis]
MRERERAATVSSVRGRLVKTFFPPDAPDDPFASISKGITCSITRITVSNKLSRFPYISFSRLQELTKTLRRIVNCRFRSSRPSPSEVQLRKILRTDPL